MNLEVQSPVEAIETNLIDRIDSESLLVINSGSYVEVEKRNGMDIAFEEESNDIMGRVFDTPDDAYDFYNHYAFLHGFGVHILNAYKNKTTNEHYRRMYVCNKEGFKDLKCKSSVGDVKKRRRDLRTGCNACLRIKKKDGKWFVDVFNDSHNHELTVSPTKVLKHRSYGKFYHSLACKSLMAELGQFGLKPCQIKKVINAMKSTHENNVTSKQCSNALVDQQKQCKGKEIYGLIKHFQDKFLEDQLLYFVVDLFDDGSPRNIFWDDGRSRESYIKFRDVVVFDVTYMTNKFKMPFASFVGVNHHGQSILFVQYGKAVEARRASEEDEDFRWTLDTRYKMADCTIGIEDTHSGNEAKDALLERVG
ncbi:protein FAR1-RELATED SEQUENCE 5-like [Bidens hawaiensis]|uniref:protein FAR1-RELATED SEQUENCE 5-like n=1 Tax=Bidens hawaiensis TaxID=980011 RepID=UPI00404B9C45